MSRYEDVAILRCTQDTSNSPVVVKITKDRVPDSVFRVREIACVFGILKEGRLIPNNFWKGDQLAFVSVLANLVGVLQLWDINILTKQALQKKFSGACEFTIVDETFNQEQQRKTKKGFGASIGEIINKKESGR